jgi:hypothetical protein
VSEELIERAKKALRITGATTNRQLAAIERWHDHKDSIGKQASAELKTISAGVIETPHMRHHQEIFERVRKRTGMYLAGETFPEVVGFVTGYDYACEGGTLCGFTKWLVLRLRFGSNLNLGWPALVLDAAFPGSRNPEAELNAGGAAAQRHAIATLFDLLTEFDEVRSKHDGLKKVFLEYDQCGTRLQAVSA